MALHTRVSEWFTECRKKHGTPDIQIYIRRIIGADLYIYIYIYIYMHTYIHTYVRTYMHTYIHELCMMNMCLHCTPKPVLTQAVRTRNKHTSCGGFLHTKNSHVLTCNTWSTIVLATICPIWHTKQRPDIIGGLALNPRARAVATCARCVSAEALQCDGLISKTCLFCSYKPNLFVTSSFLIC